MSSSNEVSDQFAIRNLIETYADAVFRRDAEAWGATWAQDATWHLMGNTVAGRPAIVGAWSEAMKGFKFVAFFSQPGPIQINGDVAPRFGEFLYFALTIGMTYQVSDVTTNSGAMRRLVLTHAAIAFVFNTVIIAITVGLVASLI